MDAHGTPGAPIIFTSYRDDSAGGDTDGDGGAPERGDWSTLQFQAPSDAAAAVMPISKLDNVLIRYSGFGGSTNCRSGAAVNVASNGRLELTRSEITESMNAGFEIAPLTPGIGIGKVTNTLVADSACGAEPSSGDVWENEFAASLEESFLTLTPTSLRMYGTYAHDLGTLWGEPTREQANLLFNALLGGIESLSDDPQDLRYNWWGPGQHNLGQCNTGQEFIPAVTFGAAEPGECPPGVTTVSDGYFTLVEPFLEEAPDVPDTGLGFYAVASEFPAMPKEQTFGCSCQLDSANSEAVASLDFAGIGKAASTAVQNGLDNFNGFQMFAGDPVNTATGSFTESYTDAKLPGAGITFAFTRTYNSQDPTTGSMGPGWQFGFNASLSVDPVTGDARVRAEDGQQAIYTDNPDGTFTAPPGIVSTLSAVQGGGYRLTRQDLTYLEFNSAGRLTAMKDQADQGLTLGYTSGTLSDITDAAGRTTTLTHTNGRLTRVLLEDGRHVDYGYTNGRLTSVTDLRGKTTTYDYDASGYLKNGLDPNGHWLFRNTYDPVTGRVTAQLDARGKQTLFDWDPTTEIATTTDPEGGVWTDAYRGNLLVRHIDPLGHVTRFGYDARLNLISVRNARRHTTSFGYDSAGNMVSRSAPDALSYAPEMWTYTAFNAVDTYTNRLGETTNFDYYPATHLLKKVTDPLDRSTTYTYTANGQVDTVKDPRDKVTDFDYDADGNLAKVTTPEGNITTYGYDDSGRRTSMVGPRGNAPGGTPADYTTVFAYNNADAFTSITDPRNHTTGYGYDDAGNLETLTNAEDNDTTYEYFADNRLKKVTDPRGAAVEYAYDDNGNPDTVTTPAGTTDYGYDAANRRTSEVTPRGNEAGATPSQFTWTYGYDKVGNLTAQDHPTAGTTGFEYDVLNRLTKVIDAHEEETEYGYDANSNLTSVTDALDFVTSYTYDAADQLDTMTDAKSKVTDYGYDLSGHRTSLLTPLGNEWKWTYDGDGRLATEIDPRGQVTGANPVNFTTSYAYDPAGHLKQVTRPLSRWTKFDYDRAGNLASVTDGNNHTTTYGYDAMDRLESVHGPAGTNLGTTSYGYDDSGNLESRTDAKLRQSTFTHDLAGRLTVKTTPIGEWRYTYDAASNLATVTKPSGTSTPTAGDGTITYSYDKLDRLTGIDYSETGTPDVTYGYDELYRQSMTDGAPGSPETYTHDALGHLKTVTRGSSGFSYDYDGLGQITNRTHPDGTTIGQTWDDDRRPKVLTSSAISGTTASATYGYDPAGNLKTISRSNGATDTFTYDDTGWVSSISAKRADNGIVANHTFTYDQVGNPLAVHRQHSLLQNDNETYQYDNANRLTAVCYATSCNNGNRRFYTYDEVGNRLTENRIGGTKTGLVTLSYNTKDQLTKTSRPSGLLGQLEVITYDYDTNGNRTRAGDRTFTFDLADRPTSTTSGSTTTNYAYDGNGLRLSSTTGSATTDYTWDQNYPNPELVAETAGSVSQKFVNDPSGSPVATLIPGTGTGTGPHYFHDDPLGTVRAATDAVTGTRRATYDYEPFGTSRTSPTNQGSLDNPIGFTGEYQESTAGLYHLRARDYDTTTGRFDGLDPVAGQVQSPYLSEYQYVSNQPTVFTDPSGRCILGAPCPDVIEDVIDDPVGALEDAGDALAGGAETVGNGLVGIAEATTNHVSGCSAQGLQSSECAWLFADLVSLGGIEGTIQDVRACLNAGLISAECAQAGIDIALLGAGGAASAIARCALKSRLAAANAVPATNKIYSNRALQRMADEPGPMHNFPASFDETVFSQGTRTVNPGYFNKAKPNLGNDSIQYRLPGVINGRSGVYEIFTRPSTSGRTEMIIHRFFRPDY